MPFPWKRYWIRVAAIIAVALIVSVVGAMAVGGRLSGEGLIAAAVDSLMLAIVVAFPLTRRAYRGPHA